MKPIDIRGATARSEPEDEPVSPRYEGPAVLSYGFRPFFLTAALFAAVAVPFWALIYAGLSSPGLLYPPREWHVHEMLFGFLPAVISGFLLTAVPNWTGRPPLRGTPLLVLFSLWLAGRLALAFAAPVRSLAVVIDGAYLVLFASYLWRELARGGRLNHTPVAVIVSLFAVTNLFFHVRAQSGSSTDLPERMVVALLLLLLLIIGGRLTPNFTREYLMHIRQQPLPPPFTRFDGAAVGLALAGALGWVAQPVGLPAGALLVTAGVLHLVRLWRWQGRLAWREPLVFVLHVGYGWIALSMLALGGAALGVGLLQPDAVHVLTTGAVGLMTLAVMTRASLGHTGRPKQVGPLTLTIYVLVMLGALLRVFVPGSSTPTTATYLVLGLAAICWGGAYLLFTIGYGPWLLEPSLDE